MKYPIFIFLIFSPIILSSCSSKGKTVIHPLIVETVDYCLKNYISSMQGDDIPLNEDMIRDYDSINISMLFYLDTNNSLCYDVFSFHQLADTNTPFLGCYWLDKRTLLYIYDESGLAHNFIDTTQLLKPWASRPYHVYRYPKTVCGEAVIEGLEYFYVIGYQCKTEVTDDSLILKSVVKRTANTINQEFYSFYPQMKKFLGIQ